MDTDNNTTIKSLRDSLRNFRDDRDWGKFHDPKNLAEAISIEAAELLELFLWKSPEEVASALDLTTALRSPTRSQSVPERFERKIRFRKEG